MNILLSKKEFEYMNIRLTLVGVGAVIALAGCSATTPVEPPPPPVAMQSEGKALAGGGYVAQANVTVPGELECPESGSRAAAGKPRAVEVKGSSSDKLVAIGGGATIHIFPGVVFSGDLIVCGGSATLILDGALKGRAHIEGGGVRVILVDRDPNPETQPSKKPGEKQPEIFLTGAYEGFVFCYEGTKREGQRPCADLF